MRAACGAGFLRPEEGKSLEALAASQRSVLHSELFSARVLYYIIKSLVVDDFALLL